MRQSIQIIRFVIVGFSNAVITAVVVWALMHLLGCNYLWSNMAGYVAALVNNFFWSKYWVFAVGKGSFLRQSLLFLVAFAFAYVVLIVVGCLILMADDAGFEESIGAVVTCLGNVGPGLGTCGPVSNFAGFSDFPNSPICISYLVV